MRCKQCKRKHNIGGFSGASMTPYKCTLCGNDAIWHDLNPPKLCGECMTRAIKNKDRCHWCGSLFIKSMENEHE